MHSSLFISNPNYAYTYVRIENILQMYLILVAEPQQNTTFTLTEIVNTVNIQMQGVSVLSNS